MKKHLIVLQQGNKDCGAASLLSIIRYYGGDVSLDRLIEMTGTTKEGTNFYNISEVASKFRLIAKGFKVDEIDKIKEINSPFIVQIKKNNYSHFMVVYKVFDNKDIYEFNTLVLRSGSQEQTGSMMRDELLTSIAYKYGTLDAQAYKPVVLYINGKYWGVYYLREKIEDDFIQNNYNVSGPTNIVSSSFVAEEGINSDVIKLKNYVKNHDLRDEDNYLYVNGLLDVENYIDFWVYQFILNNSDLHNFRYYNNPNVSSNRIRMILYDLDYALYGNSGAYYLSYMQNPVGMLTYVDNSILASLMKNEKFKKKFLDRLSYYMKNVWTSENVTREFDYIYNMIQPEMYRNCERWGYDYNVWLGYTRNLKSYALSRNSQVKYAARSYFGLTLEEANEYFY